MASGLSATFFHRLSDLSFPPTVMLNRMTAACNSITRTGPQVRGFLDSNSITRTGPQARGFHNYNSITRTGPQAHDFLDSNRITRTGPQVRGFLDSNSITRTGPQARGFHDFNSVTRTGPQAHGFLDCKSITRTGLQARGFLDSNSITRTGPQARGFHNLNNVTRTGPQARGFLDCNNITQTGLQARDFHDCNIITRTGPQARGFLDCSNITRTGPQAHGFLDSNSITRTGPQARGFHDCNIITRTGPQAHGFLDSNSITRTGLQVRGFHDCNIITRTGPQARGFLDSNSITRTGPKARGFHDYNNITQTGPQAHGFLDSNSITRTGPQARGFLDSNSITRTGPQARGFHDCNIITRTSPQARGFQDYRDSPRVLITGALGQLGYDLAKLMRERYGRENVIMSDIKKPTGHVLENGPFLFADVLDVQNLRELVVNYDIDWLVHFSTLVSVTGEQKVEQAKQVNIEGVHNVLEVAKNFGLKLFIPSTIGAFGPDSPRDPTPDLTIQRPRTFYGVSKVHAELMGEYYHHRFGLDFRSLRYPGVISADTMSRGGTTDYLLDIFHDALTTKQHVCYLRPDTRLPTVFIDDVLRGTIDFMETGSDKLSMRTYNVTAMSLTPEEMAEEVRKYVPDLEVIYQPDYRQSIADQWPEVMDDSKARQDWDWAPRYNLSTMCEAIMKELIPKYTESGRAVGAIEK